MRATGKARPQRTARSTARPPTRSRSAGAPVHWISEQKLRRLQERLREAQETLDAIRSGEVDAVVVHGTKGNQVYSLAGADQPYRVYVEQMQEGAVTVSNDGLVLYCNQRFADMVKQPLERVIGSKIHQYLTPAAWQKLATVFPDGGQVVKHESLLLRLDQNSIPINLTASRLPLEGQSVVCLVVTDLTAHQEQAKLRLAKEVAEKANEAKDSFLAALSHELRTPLTPVLMAATSLTQNPNLPVPVRKELAMIRRNVELEARLIDDLLDLTRVTRGKLEFYVGPINIHAVLHRALEICQADLDAKRQHLVLELNATRTATQGDAVRIQQVLWNLLRNAVKFTGEGGVITIRTRNASPNTITLAVQDTGVGFAPLLAAKLFQAFEQGGRDVTRQYGGLGLGLTISRSIVESHGGTIHGHSDGPGKGAIFTLELPLRAPRALHPGAPDRPEADPLPKTGPGKRILLVEDHTDTRQSLETLLSKHKHEVKAVASARQALALAATHQFDLVVSDIGLPDHSGLELMAELRDRFGLKGIGLSGYGMEEDIARSRAAGFLYHLVKPIRFDRLEQLIATIDNPPESTH